MQEREKKIYVIDDEAEICEVVKSTIETYMSHCVVEVFRDLQGPLEKIANNEMPDLIITDLKLESNNGTRISRFVKNQPGANYVPVIIMSGHFNGRNIGDALSSGCDDVLVKPFSPQDLTKKIKQLFLLYC